MAEALIKAVVTVGIVTGNAEDGTVIDAVPGDFLLVNESCLVTLSDRLKRWEDPKAAKAASPKTPPKPPEDPPKE